MYLYFGLYDMYICIHTYTQRCDFEGNCLETSSRLIYMYINNYLYSAYIHINTYIYIYIYV